MTKIADHVEKVLEQLQSPNEEREELREELVSHLEETKQQYIDDGLTEKKAEERALKEFGDFNNIGHEMQEAMYPYQRGLLYGIGLGTILFGVFFYLASAYLLHDRIPGWLAIQLLTGGTVTLAAINISFVGRYFYLVNVMLLINVLWNGINITIMELRPQWQAVFFSIYLLILIGIGLVAVIRNSYYSSGPTETKQQKCGLVLLSHIVNLLFGLVVAGVSLFFLWALLAFSEVKADVILTLVPIIIWLITYKFQMGYISKKPLISIATGLGFSVLSIALPYTILGLL
ncbi:permease prefix domain 1-containing protein [Lentibacillus jeotgali]|uniref:permease prefix domain 1-containing protein n=1 Tax=Lentibacillus jeotgali TaxID=558169 RepID=UPI0002626BB2|nr:permease prefix domain 1-containing protein [Lentibacillus jeotgali]